MDVNDQMRTLARALAPSRWRHPILRRRWLRFARTVLTSPIALAHWSGSEAADRFWHDQAKAVIDALNAEYADQLPEGSSFGFVDSPVDES